MRVLLISVFDDKHLGLPPVGAPGAYLHWRHLNCDIHSSIRPMKFTARRRPLPMGVVVNSSRLSCVLLTAVNVVGTQKHGVAHLLDFIP